MQYDWPGNIRELKNVVERAVYRNNNAHVPVHNIVLDPFASVYRPKTRIKTPPASYTPPSSSVSTDPSHEPTYDKSVPANTIQEPLTNSPKTPDNTPSMTFPLDLKARSQAFEITMIKEALKDSQFNQKKTAQKLSLTYHQLRGYLKKYSLLDEGPDLQ
jgi:psp operon transcriptional activator